MIDEYEEGHHVYCMNCLHEVSGDEDQEYYGPMCSDCDDCIGHWTKEQIDNWNKEDEATMRAMSEDYANSERILKRLGEGEEE